jgi:hypothetical protein
MLLQFHILFIPTFDLQLLKLISKFFIDYFTDAILIESSLILVHI